MHFRGFHTVDLFDCPPFQMFTNADDPASVAILEHRNFEPHSMRVWCALVRNATAIIDIGAHVGVYSLAAAALRNDIQIHAFEPNPFTAARLRVNKHVNAFDHIIEHNIALAEAHGVANVTWIIKPRGWLSSGSGLGSERESGWEKAPVYVKPFDSRGIKLGDNAIFKIDVEGGEYNVFKGMMKALQSRPTIILESFSQGNCDFIASHLSDYRFFLIDERGTLIEQDRLISGLLTDDNKNQLLLPKERASILPALAPAQLY